MSERQHCRWQAALRTPSQLAQAEQRRHRFPFAAAPEMQAHSEASPRLAAAAAALVEVRLRSSMVEMEVLAAVAAWLAALVVLSQVDRATMVELE
jgi:hypothetical protein